MSSKRRQRNPKRQRELLAAALDYGSKGIRVFPIYEVLPDGTCACGRESCDNAGKHPRPRNGLKAATTDERKIKAWWKRWPEANLGGIPGPKFIVVDVDPRNGGDGALRALESEFSPLPPTATVLTGEYEIDGETVRGMHHWFALPEGSPPLRTKTLARGVDLISDGRYVLLPPSIHPSGVEYE